MTRRRWIADRWTANSATLLDVQAAHLARVLRAQIGQEFDIVAGNAVRRGVIERIAPEAVEFALHEEVAAADSLPLTVALSIVRFERMEWAIEKLTELGVARIVPLMAQRSEKHLVEATAKRCERWRKIARESAQQSRRGNVPEIAEPMSMIDCIRENENALRFLLSEQERTQSLWESLMTTERNATASGEICAAIGPEGGWTSTELLSFAESGWRPVSLGSTILRTETAAIAVASLLNAWWTRGGMNARD
ncbi:MAG: RsmE family RNA methyltransferase [Acidobacteriaceae bacterium]